MNELLDRVMPRTKSETNQSILKSVVIKKLERFRALTAQDRIAVLRITSAQKTISAQQNLTRAGKCLAVIRFITQGYACQYTMLSDGRRQIIALLLPGDECSSYMSMSAPADYNICALTDVTFSEAAPSVVLPLLDESPTLAEALWRSTLVNEAILRERIINLGRRSAKERLAHLFCESFVRSEAVGLATGMQCMVPLYQLDIADMLGLSLVHINRVLQALRADNLILFEAGVLTILDYDRLQKAAQFHPRYLQGHPDVDWFISLPALSARRVADQI